MPKKRHRDPSEYYKGILREKDKEIRSLQKRIRALEKQEHLYTQTVDELVEAITEDNKHNKCPQCKEGILFDLDLKYVVYETCKCGYKEKKKTIQQD